MHRNGLSGLLSPPHGGADRNTGLSNYYNTLESRPLTGARIGTHAGSLEPRRAGQSPPRGGSSPAAPGHDVPNGNDR